MDNAQYKQCSIKRTQSSEKKSWPTIYWNCAAQRTHCIQLTYSALYLYTVLQKHTVQYHITKGSTAAVYWKNSSRSGCCSLSIISTNKLGHLQRVFDFWALLKLFPPVMFHISTIWLLSFQPTNVLLLQPTKLGSLFLVKVFYIQI